MCTAAFKYGELILHNSVHFMSNYINCRCQKHSFLSFLYRTSFPTKRTGRLEAEDSQAILGNRSGTTQSAEEIRCVFDDI